MGASNGLWRNNDREAGGVALNRWYLAAHVETARRAN
jgi:hypothetical protein